MNTYRDGILPGVPTRMQDLLVEVQRVRLHRVPKPSGPSPILRSRFTGCAADLLGLERRLIRLENHVLGCVGVVYPEVVMI